MKQKILRVLPFITTVMIMLLIFFLSSQTREESSRLSSGLTKKLIDFFAPHADLSDKKLYLDMLHNIIRKCAHFVLYASLGFSSAGMFLSDKITYKRMWIYTVIFTAVYAASDELHQSMVAGRGPMISDVVLDSFGGGFGAAVFLVLILLARKDRKND